MPCRGPLLPLLLSVRYLDARQRGDGIWRRRREFNPRWPLRGSRQFSGLVTLATRPLLHGKKLERRRGIEPRTPGLLPGRSPLAVAAHVKSRVRWHPGGDSNTQSRVWNPLASPSATGACLSKIGRPGQIRTDTERSLSALPLPDWATSLWCSGRDSNSQGCGSRPHASAICATRTLVGSQGFEPWMFLKELPGLQPGAFSHSANCPNANCQRSGGRQATRTPMSQWDPGLAGQWDTNYPSLPSTNYKMDFAEKTTDRTRDTRSVRLSAGTIGGRN
jgi:hypothetical protein